MVSALANERIKASWEKRERIVCLMHLSGFSVKVKDHPFLPLLQLTQSRVPVWFCSSPSLVKQKWGRRQGPHWSCPGRGTWAQLLFQRTCMWCLRPAKVSHLRLQGGKPLHLPSKAYPIPGDRVSDLLFLVPAYTK